MNHVFLELLFDCKECADVGIESRDEIEDGLDDVLKGSELGAVTGGGGGMGRYNIDVEIFDEHRLNDAVSRIRIFLVSMNVPQSSRIIRHQPRKEELSVYV